MANVSFQKTVGRLLAPGQPGDRANMAPEVVTAYLAGTDLVPGTFACNLNNLTGAMGGVFSSNAPMRAGYITNPDASILLAGLVTRDTTGVIGNLTDSYQNVINAGLNVQIASRGEFIVYLDEIANGTAWLGSWIDILDPATGAPSLRPYGGNPSAPIQTQWALVAILDGPSGLGVISTWRQG